MKPFAYVSLCKARYVELFTTLEEGVGCHLGLRLRE